MSSGDEAVRTLVKNANGIDWNRKRLDSIILDCEKEMSRLQGLQQQKMEL
jgi:hypothetical protein